MTSHGVIHNHPESLASNSVILEFVKVVSKLFVYFDTCMKKEIMSTL